MVKVLVTGAGGFIGTHLVRYLKENGYWVLGVDLKYPQWSESATDQFQLRDLRILENCLELTSGIDEVYDLAADMGGMGFISNNNATCLFNNTLINANMIEASKRAGVKRYFFSSSVCVYPSFRLETTHPKKLKEEDVLPAWPSEGYGWQKLVHEIRCLYYKKEFGLETRVARFDNVYGPEGTFEGGREKAPAALCRKVILANDNSEIEVWGDGKQVRPFVYIDDIVKGICLLSQSEYDQPVNLGAKEKISISHLARLIIKISGKNLGIRYVPGPEGARGRNFSYQLAKEKIGWEAKVSLEEGISKTFNWIKERIETK